MNQVFKPFIKIFCAFRQVASSAYKNAIFWIMSAAFAYWMHMIYLKIGLEQLKTIKTSKLLSKVHILNTLICQSSARNSCHFVSHIMNNDFHKKSVMPIFEIFFCGTFFNFLFYFINACFAPKRQSKWHFIIFIKKFFCELKWMITDFALFYLWLMFFKSKFFIFFRGASFIFLARFAHCRFSIFWPILQKIFFDIEQNLITRKTSSISVWNFWFFLPTFAEAFFTTRLQAIFLLLVSIEEFKCSWKRSGAIRALLERNIHIFLNHFHLALDFCDYQGASSSFSNWLMTPILDSQNYYIKFLEKCTYF